MKHKVKLLTVEQKQKIIKKALEDLFKEYSCLKPAACLEAELNKNCPAIAAVTRSLSLRDLIRALQFNISSLAVGRNESDTVNVKLDFILEFLEKAAVDIREAGRYGGVSSTTSSQGERLLSAAELIQRYGLMPQQRAPQASSFFSQ